MEAVFNEELFDELTTTDLEKCVSKAGDDSLKKLVQIRDIIKKVNNEELGLEEVDLTFDKMIVLTNEPQDKLKVCVFWENVYDTLSVNEVMDLIKKSRIKLIKKLKDLGGFAQDELMTRNGEYPEESVVVPCERSDMYKGEWIDTMRCGIFENYQGLLVFRPRIGAVMYHGSPSFKEGDPFDDPIWFGTYENSMQYIEDGYMNLFRIKRSPRLLVLTNVDNIEYILAASTDKEKHAISKVTGVEQTDLKSIQRQFGCAYEDKSPIRFSRFSSREEDMMMAKVICSIPGLDGYIQPAINYCSWGVTYREGEKYPPAKRFNGEVVICNASNFVERVVEHGIPCAQDAGEECDISREMWEREFENVL